MSQPYRASKIQNPGSGKGNVSGHPPTSLRPQPSSSSTLASESGLARSERTSTLPPLSSLAGFPEGTGPRSLAGVALPTRSPEHQRPAFECYAPRNAPSSVQSLGGQPSGEQSQHRQGIQVGPSPSSRNIHLRDVSGVNLSGSPSPHMMRPQSIGPDLPGFLQTSAQTQRHQRLVHQTGPYSPVKWSTRTTLPIPPASAASVSTSPGPTTSSQASPFQTTFPPTPSGFITQGQDRESASSTVDLRRTDPDYGSQQASDYPYNTSSGTQYMTVETAQGPMSIPVDVQGASKIADEKRRRNAGASARFRARRKEKEQANSKEIDDLRQQIRDLGEDAEFYRRERDLLVSVLYRTPERDRYFPRPQSPRRQRPLRDYQRDYREFTENSPKRQDTPTFEEYGERGARGRHTRRRLTGEDPLPAFELAESPRSIPVQTSQRPLAGYSYPPTQTPGFSQVSQLYETGVPRAGPQATQTSVMSSGRSLPLYQPGASGAVAAPQHPIHVPSSSGSGWSRDSRRR